MMPSARTSKAAANALMIAPILFAFCLSTTSVTAQERCFDTPVEVNGASEQELHLTCAAAKVALLMLGRCSIFVRRQLNIHILREVKHPLGGQVFGLFDTGGERILVTQHANVGPLIQGTPYSEIPTVEFYGSLVVHEVVHGVLHQHYGRQPKSHAVYEYPAYAIQLESLSPSTRQKFLQSSTQATTARQGFLFTDTILLFDPYFFAARSYQHFKSSVDGCAHLRALLEGDVDFVVTAP